MCALSVSLLQAQSRSPVAVESAEPAVQLSPFVVYTPNDEGYRATSTLAGTRLNTNLFDTPAAISVLTKELLDDIGAQNTEDFMRYSTNTSFDIGGETNATGSQWYDAPTRIRGFGGATVTRDYFPWAMGSDVFSVERVDVSRGPNAVLYGVGAPGGVLNTSSKIAHLNSRQGVIALTVGSFANQRAELDVGLPLVRNVLALRLNTVFQDRKGWRHNEFFKQKGLALATNYQPFKKTILRANLERRLVQQQKPGGTSDDFGGTRWIAAGGPAAPNPLQPGTNPAPQLLRTRNIEQVIYAPQLRAQPFRMSTIGADMRPDLPGVQASGFWDTVPGPTTPAAGSVDDPYLGTMIPLKQNTSGLGNTTSFDYTVGSLYFEQRIGGLMIELACQRLKLWRDNRSSGFSAGLYGDPNPVLPGAYLADGDSRLAVGRDPGTLLADIGAPNPYFGKLYGEGQAQARPFLWDQVQYRASLGYEIDLTKYRNWLGRHTISGLWQRNDHVGYTWVEREYNIAPNNTQLLDSATNSIYRRTYVDFTSPNGLRGQIDPWTNPIVAPGVKSAFVAIQGAGPSTGITDSLMAAAQSKFLENRLILTGGLRQDTQRTWSLMTDPRTKVTNSTSLYSGFSYLKQPVKEFKGHTSTFGAVLHPLNWIGLSYNQSDSILPQSQPNPYGQSYGIKVGEGKDAGLRFNLLEGRLFLNLNLYETTAKNDVTTVFLRVQQSLSVTVPAIIDTLKLRGQPLPASMVAAGVDNWDAGNGHTVDSSGKGVEIELVGAITKNWSVTLNVSHNTLGLTNIAPFHNGFVAEVTPAWKGNLTPLAQTPTAVADYVITRDKTPARDFVLNPATINDTYEHIALQVASMNRSDGQRSLQNQAEHYNLFTSYRFAPQAPAFLRRMKTGIGCTYRSAPVIGYDAANNNEPNFGRSEFYVNLMLGKSIPLRKNATLDFQLNVQNLLGDEDLLPFLADSPGKVLVQRYPSQYRSWMLKASHRF